MTDEWACLSTVVQAYKDFTGGWQWKGNQKIDKMVTSTTSNVRLHSISQSYPEVTTADILQFIKIVLQKELNLALRKRKRCYATMIHFVHLGTQLWQNDWLRYDRPGIRIEVWAEIQLHAFTAARIGEYVESTARPGSGRGLHFRVSAISWSVSLGEGSCTKARWDRISRSESSEMRTERRNLRCRSRRMLRV